MGIFRQFPYSNFHDMNMDELIKIVKNMLDDWAQYYDTWDDWKDQVTRDWEEMQTFINTYFDNLDVQTEINNKIISMVNSGEFSQIVDPYVPPAVAAWLAEHITTPESVVIDDSLTIEGAAADAEATGKAARNLSKYGALNVCPIISGTDTPSHFTVVADGKGNYTISGYGDAANQWYRTSLFYDANAFPNGYVPGQKILATCYASDNNNLALEINFAIGGVLQLAQYIKNGETALIDIPSNATGMLIGVAMMGNIIFTNATVTPLIFTDKTKNQYDSELNTLSNRISTAQNDVDLVESYMPHGYRSIAVTSGVGIYNRWAQLNVVAEYQYATVPVNEDEKYQLSGYYQGGNFPAFLYLDSNGGVVSYENADAQGKFIDIETTVPENAVTLIVNGRPATQNPVVNQYQMVPIKAVSYDGVLIGPNDNYEYQNINSAVKYHPSSIIFIDCGTYETEVENLATDKILIGKDRDLCVLEKNGGAYDNPPIEIAGGMIKNLTVNMVNDPDAVQYGYCVHSDNAATANKVLLISNCKFDNDLYRVIGMGVRGGETVVFENCEFVGHGETSGQSIYIHNSTGTKATVKFHNCYFQAVEECLQLQGWGSDCEIDWEFINCTCYSETYGAGIETVWTDYVSGDVHDTSRLHEFSGKFTLLPTSHGNNISVLNA